MRDKVIGQVPVRREKNGLYMTYGGGDFTHGKIKGSFAGDVSGTTLVVYVHEGDTYTVAIKDVIEAAIKHHNGEKRA